MAVAFGALGTKTEGTTSLALPYATGVAAGVLALACRYFYTATGPSTPAGWTLGANLAGGTGSSTDAHTGEARVDYRELDGSESGTVSFSNGGSVTGSIGFIAHYTKGAGEVWDLAFTSGDDNTHGATRSNTGSALALAPGDVLVAAFPIDSDAALTYASATLSAPGITFGGGTVRRSTSSIGTVNGPDGNIDLFDATVTAGTASAAPTLALATSSPANCGPVIFARLRAVTAPDARPRNIVASNPALMRSVTW